MKLEFVSFHCEIELPSYTISIHNFMHPRVATIATSVPRGAFAFVTKKLRDEKIVDVPLCTTNRINAPTTIEALLADGSSDLVSMARPFLADPEIVSKSREGRPDDINTVSFHR